MAFIIFDNETPPFFKNKNSSAKAQTYTQKEPVGPVIHRLVNLHQLNSSHLIAMYFHIFHALEHYAQHQIDKLTEINLGIDVFQFL